MPNWCNNGLVVKGKKEDLDNFKTKYKGTFTDNQKDITWIDFTKVIPNKEEKEKWLPEWEKLSDKDKQSWNNDFNLYWFNVGKGANWQVSNWRTKWNPEISEPTQTEDSLNYGFDTAWSPCDEIVKTLIEKHPELEFELEFEEWGNCFRGEVTGKDGEILTDITEECDIGECPECEMTNLKSVDEEEFVCGDCATKYKGDENDNE